MRKRLSGRLIASLKSQRRFIILPATRFLTYTFADGTMSHVSLETCWRDCILAADVLDEPSAARPFTELGACPRRRCKVFAGIAYRLRTGCQWDATASELGRGSTCYRRLSEWVELDAVCRTDHDCLIFVDREWRLSAHVVAGRT